MKRLLIISPHFVPSNAADMQRVRMSLPYFEDFGWEAEVVTVDERYSEIIKDDLLPESLPNDIKTHKVKALNKAWTSKLGLGSLALRSLWFYRQKVNQLLKKEKFDLIYFSTTQFPVCILGAYWKKRFNIPYVIDMQDPWHSDYYQNKPKHQQPAKYWFSYRLNKYLEPIAMKHVAGLISVSEHYISDLKARYVWLSNIPIATITFGAFDADIKIADDNKNKFKSLLNPAYKNIIYIGRGGADMHKAVSVLFNALKKCITGEPVLFEKLRLHFIGTSYAPNGQGTPTLSPLAKQFGLQDKVIEITARISYYHTLLTLQQADGLFMPGSDNPDYTASKIYPYLLSNKPLLAIFNSQSPAMGVLHEYGVKSLYSYDATPDVEQKVSEYLKEIANGSNNKQYYNADAIEKYSAQNMAKRQCILFDKVING